MAKGKNINDNINAKGIEISVLSSTDKEDYISLTDMARFKNSEATGLVISHWLSTRYTVEFLGVWETIHNPNFNVTEFRNIKNMSGSNGYVLSSKQWIGKTKAIGITSKAGRYGSGTFAHKDIAFEFASWLSPEFKLYIIKDYQRLKESETHQSTLDWNVKRILTKTNYKIHTDAIKENLIPPDLSSKEQGYIYADEADVLNVAMFGKTAAQWRSENPDKQGNMRDYAEIEQLIVLINLESANAMFVSQGLPRNERLQKLREMVIVQMKQLTGLKSVNDLKQLHNQLRLSLSDEKDKKKLK